MAGYNLTRSVEELLEAHEDSPPSFTVHLFPEYWTLNNGFKFLYNNQVASLLDDIRAQRIPNDFLELFDSAQLPFYDGCMIVELLDYRPSKGKDPILEKPERTRVVLSPNSETLWTDICLLNQKQGGTWTDEEATEVEARILMSTAPPLCLEPDPHLVRIANNILRVSVPTTPASLKRKAAAMEQEEDESEKVRRAKIMQYMNPKNNRATVPSYRILDLIQRMKAQKSQPPAALASAPASASPHPASTPVSAPVSTPAPVPTPTSFSAPTRPAPTPTPRVSTPATNGLDPKLKAKKHEATSPLIGRPTSTVPAAFPPHMQTHYAMGHSSPPSIHTPRPPSSVASARSPERPPSTTQQPLRPQSTQPQQVHPSPVRPPSVAAQPQQPQQPIPTFQPAVPGANFLTQPPIPKKKMPQQPAGMPQGQLNAQQAQLVYAQQYQLYQQQQAAIQAHQAAQSQTASPISQAGVASSQGSPQHRSPMAPTQPLASRSPMPPNAAQPQPPAQMTQQAYNYALAAQNQYNAAHLRPMAHGHAPHPQMMAHHLSNGGVQAAAAASQQGQPAQGQEQAHPPQAVAQYPPMYGMNFAQMGMNMGMQVGRMPQGYWGLGRGMPVANGQHQMAAHAQQMSLGAGKAVPGGMQGT